LLGSNLRPLAPSAQPLGHRSCNSKMLFTCVLNTITPVKNIQVKQHHEPWFNDDMIKGIKERNTALDDFKGFNDQSWCVDYGNLQNDVQCQIDATKDNYFKDKLRQPRKTSANTKTTRFN